jgi:hypothetical protein
VRINVYSEELTDEVRLVTKKMDDGRVFYGLRFFVKSAPELHDDPEDDDRSAITLWVPWSRQLGNDPSILFSLLANMQDALNEEFG